MTRFLALSFAVLALAFSACERHPLGGQSLVTHTHGSNGAHEEGHGHGHGDSHAAAEHGKKAEAHAPAAAHAPADAHGKKAEEKPTFFPEKK